MKIIYEPSGRAREYAELACNLFTGCPHGCLYCYVPGCVRKPRKEFHSMVSVKKDALYRLEKDCEKMAAAGDNREVLFCFTCDPFPRGKNSEELQAVAFLALGLMDRYRLSATVLTKNPMAAIPLFPVFRQNGWRFGVSLSFCDEILRKKWEPAAASITNRIQALALAHQEGVKTWVSVEPVIDPDEALAVIERAKPYVNEWKIGKWNHDARANAIDWPDFLQRAEKLLHGRRVVWKDDLLRAAGAAL